MGSLFPNAGGSSSSFRSPRPSDCGLASGDDADSAFWQLRYLRWRQAEVVGDQRRRISRQPCRTGRSSPALKLWAGRNERLPTAFHEFSTEVEHYRFAVGIRGGIVIAATEVGLLDLSHCIISERTIFECEGGVNGWADSFESNKPLAGGPSSCFTPENQRS